MCIDLRYFYYTCIFWPLFGATVILFHIPMAPAYHGGHLLRRFLSASQHGHVIESPYNIILQNHLKISFLMTSDICRNQGMSLSEREASLLSLGCTSVRVSHSHSEAFSIYSSYLSAFTKNNNTNLLTSSPLFHVLLPASFRAFSVAVKKELLKEINACERSSEEKVENNDKSLEKGLKIDHISDRESVNRIADDESKEQKENEIEKVIIEDKKKDFSPSATFSKSSLRIKQIQAGVKSKVFVEKHRRVLQALEKNFPDRQILPINENITSYLISLGASKKDIVKLFNDMPALWKYDPDVRLMPMVELLTTYGLQLKEIRVILLRRPLCLQIGFANMQSSLLYLTNTLRAEKLGKILATASQILGLSVENLEEKRILLLEAGMVDVGAAVDKWPNLFNHGYPAMKSKMKAIRIMLDIQDISRILVRFPHILGMNVDTLSRSYEGLVKVFGKQDAREMIILQPGLLTRTWDILEAKIIFISENMDGGHEALRQWPTSLTYSLESRIMPRFKMLKNTGLGKSFRLNSVLSVDSETFVRRCRESPERFFFVSKKENRRGKAISAVVT